MWLATNGATRGPAPLLLTLIVIVCAALSSGCGDSGAQNGVATACSDGSWTEVSQSGDIPSGVRIVVLSYDSSADKFVLSGAERNVLATTWLLERDGWHWAKVPASIDGPIARTGQSMVYDCGIRQSVLFGGHGTVGGMFADTWLFDSASRKWAERGQVGISPLARSGQAAVYDDHTEAVVVFGGELSDTTPQVGELPSLANDTWILDPSTDSWTELHPSGDVPVPRSYHSMVFDQPAGRVVMFGGLTNDGLVNDTWTFDPSTQSWTELHPSGDVPSPRDGQSMVYDSRSGQIFMFGGSTDSGYSNELWTFDLASTTWRMVAVVGDAPAPRYGQGMAFDPVSDTLVVVGGVVDGYWDDAIDVWEYTIPR